MKRILIVGGSGFIGRALYKELDDKVFEDNDVRIVVDKKSFLYLVGTTLEYSRSIGGVAKRIDQTRL